ncbi:[protein-PII] uridylyltransferase [Actinomadura madurae]|uniref:[protein-PII] uridylyltransferase n=1 Tax=Actinomadura madurae TaxID=1993 RepID=A0A1I4W357_9ACTN|nr:ACT domain-containing protein [Actinomadura madurae]SFN07931.1 [protein-PII] uridylyltransferase [Actinomadura madurae]
MTLARPPAGDRAPAPAPAGGTGTADTARAALARARAARAAELDRWLADLLAAGPVPDGVALVAVGSHARRELTPGGDLDLVLLHRGLAGVAALADRVWYPVWDSGTRLDHSVRTVHEARTVARGDMKAALGLLSARRISGDHALVDELRAAVLTDWRADAPARLNELSAMCRDRWEAQGELAFLQEPDLKEAHGGLRDVHVMHAVAASWVASAPDARVRSAHDLLLDVRHALHEVTGRSSDRLVLQEKQAVAETLGLLDADVLQRSIAEAARTITYAASHLWRRVDRFTRTRASTAHPTPSTAQPPTTAPDAADPPTTAPDAAAPDAAAPDAAAPDAAAPKAAAPDAAAPDAVGSKAADSNAADPSKEGPGAAGPSAAVPSKGASGFGRVGADGRGERRPVGDGAVEYEGEVVLARNADLNDPALVLRLAAAAAQAGLPPAPATVARLAERAVLPRDPWPAEARHALVSLLGAGPAAIAVWEALDQAGLIVRLLPDWERVRNRPQRNPVHRFTVDRHLVETAAGAAALTREVARPDLLLVGALLHDIGKGWPGDHSTGGAVVARDIGARLGFPEEDVRVLETLVRHHLLLPETATRRDIDDPVTIQTVTEAVAEVPGRERELLDLLAALAIADGGATGPAAWGPWKAGLVAELARRAAAALAGGTPPPAPALAPGHLALARHDGAAVRVAGSRITIAAPDRPGLLWRAAGVLALHRLAVKTARTTSSLDGEGDTAVLDFTAVPEYGTPPDPASLEADLRRMLAGRLDVAARLERRARSVRARPGITVPPPRVMIVPDASRTATVVEVRAHDRPGLLWRIGQAFGACGVQIRAAQVDTLGAEAVDVFYVVDGQGRPLEDPAAAAAVRDEVLAALR